MIASKRILLVLLPALLTSTTPAVCVAADDAATLERQVLSAEDARHRRTLELARMLVACGRGVDARRLYEEILVLRPGDADAADELLDVLRAQGDLEAQLALSRRLMKVRGEPVSLSLQMGACLWRLKRRDAAREVWEDVLKRQPSVRGVYDLLIDFYLAEGESADAAALIARRRQRFGEDTTVLVQEGRHALVAGKPREAIAPLMRCLERDLANAERTRTEGLLDVAARRAGTAEAVTRRLRDQLAALDARLAGRLIELADAAAGRRDFADAAAFARRALPLLDDPAKRAQLTARIALWDASATKTP